MRELLDAWDCEHKGGWKKLIGGRFVCGRCANDQRSAAFNEDRRGEHDEAPQMCDCGDTALLGGICTVCGKPAPGGLADPSRHSLDTTN